MKNLQMVLLDTKSKTLEKVSVKDDLKAYYELLNCDCIDIVERKVGDKYFDIICDDEALLKDDPTISAINVEPESLKVEPMLFGNLLFCLHNEEGGTVGLSDEDCELIDKATTYVYDMNGDEHIVAVVSF